MAVTLVINPGSSSKKYALYVDKVLRINAYIERSEKGFEMCVEIGGIQQSDCELIPEKDYQKSLVNFLKQAVEQNIITSAITVDVVAVRVVAPGTYFQAHQEVNEKFLQKLEHCAALAPLHVPHTQKELQAITSILPQAKILAISDSAFHSTMPDTARLYSLTKQERESNDLYRFGYHGLSVSSVVRRLHSVTGVNPKRVIVCHIGSGVSVTAVENGRSIDTTMGYAPGSGLVMGSRAGDVDAGALLALMQKRNLKPLDAQAYLQTQGGLKALTGESDLRLILNRRTRGDLAAIQAVDSFVYQIQKAIGSFVAVLGGIDQLVFTATAAERSPILRSLLCERLSGLGINIDTDKNEACIGRDGVISSSASAVKVLVVKTNEASEILLLASEIN